MKAGVYLNQVPGTEGLLWGLAVRGVRTSLRVSFWGGGEMMRVSSSDPGRFGRKIALGKHRGEMGSHPRGSTGQDLEEIR